MKKLSGIVVLCLLLSLNANADNISDFQIEGISIGDSALDFFSEAQIKNNSKDYYTDNKFIPVQNDNMPFFETYDAVDFAYKNNDNNYTIVSLVGVLFYDDNVKDCYTKMDEIT